ncbi:MAG: hypothetical protein IPK60_19430 [Sandaracinaceae bacterium]|nr:hypothetical protein [Sandaracinaceae bacterium]
MTVVAMFLTIATSGAHAQPRIATPVMPRSTPAADVERALHATVLIQSLAIDVTQAAPHSVAPVNAVAGAAPRVYPTFDNIVPMLEMRNPVIGDYRANAAYYASAYYRLYLSDADVSNNAAAVLPAARELPRYENDQWVTDANRLAQLNAIASVRPAQTCFLQDGASGCTTREAAARSELRFGMPGVGRANPPAPATLLGNKFICAKLFFEDRAPANNARYAPRPEQLASAVECVAVEVVALPPPSPDVNSCLGPIRFEGEFLGQVSGCRSRVTATMNVTRQGNSDTLRQATGTVNIVNLAGPTAAGYFCIDGQSVPNQAFRTSGADARNVSWNTVYDRDGLRVTFENARVDFPACTHVHGTFTVRRPGGAAEDRGDLSMRRR